MIQQPECVETLGPLAEDLASAALALARRFSSGATLWCWAPGCAEHAQHVAVEFVHPVIVGARALPAVALAAGEADTLGMLRSLVRAGDVILVVVDSQFAGAEVSAVLRRAESWGAMSIVIGAGDRPAAGVADHVLWFDKGAVHAPHDGGFVLLYHLLWELTHVCFDHPGLLQEQAECDGPVCTTCSDEGTIAEVVRATARSATVRMASRMEEIDTTLVGGLAPGDLVLVHAGTALTVVEEAGADR